MRSFNQMFSKAKEGQHYLNVAILQSLTDLQQKFNLGSIQNNDSKGKRGGSSHPRGRSRSPRRGSHSHRRTKRTYPSDTLGSGSSGSDHSLDSSLYLTRRSGRIRSHRDHPYGEFRRVKPPTFDGERKTGLEAEAWLLGINKYFRIYEYIENEKAKIVVFNLNDKDVIWWENLR